MSRAAPPAAGRVVATGGRVVVAFRGVMAANRNGAVRRGVARGIDRAIIAGHGGAAPPYCVLARQAS